MLIWAYHGFAVSPYIKGLTEPLTRLLRNNRIRATSRPLKTLQQEFISLKSRPPVDQQTKVVYKIPCADCPWSYIGETGRCLKTRVTEHIRNTKAFKKGSNIATHTWLNDHSIDFNSAHLIDKGNFNVRKTLESWQLAITNEADNNANNYPDNTLFYYELQFSILFPLRIFIFFIIIFLFHTLTVYISCSRFLFITCQRLQTGN